MARGRKKTNLTLDEQMEQIIAEITEVEVHLKELSNKKKELEGQIKANRIQELDAFISSHGLTIDDVKELVEKQ